MNSCCVLDGMSISPRPEVRKVGPDAKCNAVFLIDFSPHFERRLYDDLHLKPDVCFSGGHPHNWTAISKECLNLLNDMTQKLVLYQEAAATNGRVMSSSYSMEPKKLNSPGNSLYY